MLEPGGPRAPAVGWEVEIPGLGDKRQKSSPSCFWAAGGSGLQLGGAPHRTALGPGLACSDKGQRLGPCLHDA